MPAEPILILGGTGESRKLAQGLIDAGFHPITSLAGATTHPQLPAGEVRHGGFGGEAGLTDYAISKKFRALLDATHPYSAQISSHAYAAAQAARIPYLRFERPPWRAEAGDRWIDVPNMAEAVMALPSGACAFVTIGRKQVAPFFSRHDLKGLARMIEAPDVAVPRGWTLIQARPPFSLESEISLLDRHRITHLVSKNSGGELTRTKLNASRERNIPVVMVARPYKPVAPSFSTIEEAIVALRNMLSP